MPWRRCSLSLFQFPSRCQIACYQQLLSDKVSIIGRASGCASEYQYLLPGKFRLNFFGTFYLRRNHPSKTVHLSRNFKANLHVLRTVAYPFSFSCWSKCGALFRSGPFGQNLGGASLPPRESPTSGRSGTDISRAYFIIEISRRVILVI